MTVHVCEGVYFDAEDLGERLRPIDKLECRAVSGLAPAEALRYARDHSSRWWSVFCDNKVCAVFGVSPIEGCSGWGSPWFLSSPLIFKRGELRRRFLRESPEYLKQLSHGYTRLVNYVCEHNHKSIRYLRRLGFSFHGTHYFRSYPFVEFSLCVAHH